MSLWESPDPADPEAGWGWAAETSLQVTSFFLFFLTKPARARERRAWRALGFYASNLRTTCCRAWADMPLNRYLLISLREMRPASAQVQNNELLALKQYFELPLDAMKEMQLMWWRQLVIRLLWNSPCYTELLFWRKSMHHSSPLNFLHFLCRPNNSMTFNSLSVWNPLFLGLALHCCVAIACNNNVLTLAPRVMTISLWHRLLYPKNSLKQLSFARSPSSQFGTHSLERRL